MESGSQKILLVYDVSYPHIEGGGQRRMYEVGCRLVAKGYRIDWICFKTWEQKANILKVNGIRYIGLPGFRGLYRRDGSRRRMEPIEFLISLLRYNVNLDNYDVVWSGQWPLLHILWWLFKPKSFRRARLVVDWWETLGMTWISYSKLFGPIGLFLEKILIKSISNKGTLVLISPNAYRLARSLAPDGNMSLINNGIDVCAITEAKPISGQSYDISYVGRLKDHKRVDLLIKALAILKNTYNTTLSAAIIGDGPEMLGLLQLADDVGVIGQVSFFGALSSNSKVHSILKSSKIFVNPSTKEGGGSITLFEAFASGLPAVAFLCPDGIDPELVGDFKSGRLCSTVSADALADCIYSLINDSALLSTLQSGALNEAKKYDWTVIVDSYVSLFNSMQIVFIPTVRK